MRRLVRVGVPLLLLSISRLALTQSNTGLQPFGTFSGGGVDTVNVRNGNLHISIPILSKAGRGLPFSYNLSYDSTIWQPADPDFHDDGPTNWVPASNYGWTLGSASVYGYVAYQSWTSNPNCPPGTTTYTFDGYSDVDNTFHTFRGSNNTFSWPSCNGGPTSGTVTTKDGSGITANVSVVNNIPTATVPTPSGIQVVPPVVRETLGFVQQGTNTNGPGSITDTNGNRISSSNGTTFTDTLGSTVLSVSGNNYTYTGGNGPATVTLTYSSFTVATNFGCTGGFTPINDFPPTAAQLLTKVTLADGSFYSFTYETTPGMSPDVTGRLASVALPTGGTISYTYTSTARCSDGSLTGTVVTRTTPDGQWQYSLGNGGIITDPAGNDAVYRFSVAGGFTFPAIVEAQRQVYQGSSSGGTLLATTITCYNGNFTTCGTGPAVSYPITQTDTFTVLPNGTQSLVETKYDTNQQVIEVKKYDWGVSVPPTQSPISDTIIQYAALGNNINDRPSQSTTKDSGGNTVAQTNYTYDAGTPVALSGTPQHVAITGSRGNPTSVSQLVSGTTYLTKNFTYYDTGMVQTATGINGANTTYNYPDSTSTCGNTFPTSVTLPLNLSRSSAWNCNGAVMTSATDENSQPTSYTTTDPFWRVTSLTDPLNNVVNKTYTRTSGSTPPSQESVLNFNSGASTVDALTTFDSLGRTSISQRRQAPGSTNFDTVSTIYDSNGRLFRKTMPCVQSAGTACGATGTTFTYDGAGRSLVATDGGTGTLTYVYTQNDVQQTVGPPPAGENAKSKQFEYDGLGRLTSVCEITTAGGSGTCAQTNSQTGFWTKYTYNTIEKLTAVNQNVQGTAQARSFNYDSLGRLTSETNPESGTTQYFYDNAVGSPGASCSTLAQGWAAPYNWAPPYNGDLVKKYDANGNTTCYTYDALHRPLMTIYSGPNATTNRFLVYDSATVNGVTMSYAKTHLAEAYTAGCPTCTKTIDEGFSYTQRGELADIYESTAHSGGYYHVAATYRPNGVVKTLAVFLASGSAFIPTETYNIDGEGRWKSVSASSGPNPISNTVYNPASQITGITYGSSDTDSFTYDPNTGRMTQFKYTLNTSSEIGNLTWNANATLKTLAITDPFNSSNTQSCNYGYDDLSRITSAICGAVWSQTFSYDPFGNITKSGSISWQPGYNQSTNRYTLAGTTYDANGNLTNDTFRSYVWDANGRPTTIGTKTMTYDALGRMAEKLDGGTYNQFIYSPSGTLFAVMNAQSATSVRVPLPGALALYSATNTFNHYEHLDWLGNSRLSSTQSRTMSSDIAYAPFGEAYASTTSTGVSFTGMRSDVAAVSGSTTNGLYDFLARELPPTQGRWLSPDPAGLGAATMRNPQTWNRYAYVGNNPLNSVDPLGLVNDCVGCNLSVAGNTSFAPTYVVNGEQVPAMFGQAILGMGNGGFNSFSSSAWFFNAQKALNATPALLLQLWDVEPDRDNENEEVKPRIEEEKEEEELKPEDFLRGGYQYSLLDRGPLKPNDASNFAGGRYNIIRIGRGGLSVDTPFYRVYGGTAGENGSWYALTPQVGGIQSQIDLALNPAWGNTAENVTCVYLPPGTQVAVGPISYQGGLALGGGPGLSGIQVFVPRTGSFH
jgi:RHS repeat-associated protein